MKRIKKAWKAWKSRVTFYWCMILGEFTVANLDWIWAWFRAEFRFILDAREHRNWAQIGFQLCSPLLCAEFRLWDAHRSFNLITIVMKCLQCSRFHNNRPRSSNVQVLLFGQFVWSINDTNWCRSTISSWEGTYADWLCVSLLLECEHGPKNQTTLKYIADDNLWMWPLAVSSLQILDHRLISAPRLVAGHQLIQF
jgi:hypothetical protein